jgi:hypothetical protein
MRSPCSLCVSVSPYFFVFYAVRIVPKESMRLVFFLLFDYRPKCFLKVLKDYWHIIEYVLVSSVYVVYRPVDSKT